MTFVLENIPEGDSRVVRPAMCNNTSRDAGTATLHLTETHEEASQVESAENATLCTPFEWHLSVASGLRTIEFRHVAAVLPTKGPLKHLSLSSLSLKRAHAKTAQRGGDVNRREGRMNARSHRHVHAHNMICKPGE